MTDLLKGSLADEVARISETNFRVIARHCCRLATLSLRIHIGRNDNGAAAHHDTSKRAMRSRRL